MVSTVEIFAIVAGIIVAGFIAEQFFKRTGIPSYIFLLFIGILLGPVFHILPRNSLLPALAIFAELTLLMVLFYGGMDMKLGSIASGGGRAFLQVILYVLPSTFSIAVLLHFLLGWDIVQSLIFGSMVGGETTAAVMIPLSRSLNLSELTTAFLTLESAMNSIFSIVLFFAFLTFYQKGSASPIGAVSSIASNFSVGIVLGVVISLGGILVLEKYQAQKYTYVLTLGLVFLTYSLSAELGGSGELSVLIFGIMLGNYSLLSSMRKRPFNLEDVKKQLGLFQGEISFLMETLFFVFLGLTFLINEATVVTNVIIGLILLGVLLGFRVVASHLSTMNSELYKDRYLITMMCAQGLVPATLAIIAVNDGLPLGDRFLNLVTYVIIFTNIVTSVGSIWKLKAQKRPLKEISKGLGEEYRKLT